jgi:TRAP-type C4-dicarboxylate transport system permease small subunit
LRTIANLSAFAFLAVLAWRMLPPALDAMRFHEVSPDLAIPMGVHWLLMIVGIALALPAAVWILFESLQPLWRAQNKQQDKQQGER